MFYVFWNTHFAEACHDDACKNHETCKEMENAIQCECTVEYYGQNCEFGEFLLVHVVFETKVQVILHKHLKLSTCCFCNKKNNKEQVVFLCSSHLKTTCVTPTLADTDWFTFMEMVICVASRGSARWHISMCIVTLEFQQTAPKA